MSEPKSFREVQDTLGDRFIASIKDFIEADLPTIAELERDHFSHVSNRENRAAVARAFYEARWIYKTGLVLLVQGDAQSAHVRSQAFLYGGVVEGMLQDFVEFSRHGGLLKHRFSQHRDPPRCSQPLAVGQVPEWSLYHLIKVAEAEGLLSPLVAKRLQALRKDRNSVHVSEGTEAFFLDRGRRYFGTVIEVITATKAWKRRHSKPRGSP